MKPKTVSILQVNIAVLLWGGTAMFAKGISLPTLHLVCFRSLIAAPALLIFLLATKSSVRVKRPSHYLVMILLGLLLCHHWLTYYQALKISTAAVAILSLATYPIFTALIEPFLFKEKLKASDVMLAAGVLLGVIVMTPKLDLANDTTRGIALGIVSGLFFMVRNLLTRKYVKEYSGTCLMFWQVLVAGVVLIPVVLISDPQEYSGGTLGLLVLLGIVFSAIPQSMFSAGFKNLSAKTCAVLAALLPFYGAFFGWLIHNEVVEPRTAYGGLIVLACIATETIKSAKE